MMMQDTMNNRDVWSPVSISTSSYCIRLKKDSRRTSSNRMMFRNRHGTRWVFGSDRNSDEDRMKKRMQGRICSRTYREQESTGREASVFHGSVEFCQNKPTNQGIANNKGNSPATRRSRHRYYFHQIPFCAPYGCA